MNIVSTEAKNKIRYEIREIKRYIALMPTKKDEILCVCHACLVHSKKPCRLLRYRCLSRACSSRLSRSTASTLVSAASARRTWVSG